MREAGREEYKIDYIPEKIFKNLDNKNSIEQKDTGINCNIMDALQ